MSWLKGLLGVGAALVVMGQGWPSAAAESSLSMPLKAPVRAPYDTWSGLYFGGHVGYSHGKPDVTLSDTDAISQRGSLGTLTGGVQTGYNYVLPSRLLLGIEADLSFPNYIAADDVAWFRTTATNDFAEKLDYMGTVRGRLGYAFQHWIVYATGGFAFAQGRYLQTPGVIDDTDRVLALHTGWAAGAGAEVAIAPNWTAKIEYLYGAFGPAHVTFPSGATADSSFDIHTIRTGLNYRIGGPASSGSGWIPSSGNTEFSNWEIHGQTTWIQQGYPAFRSPYLGENSFTPWAQSRSTWTISAFIGARLWDGGEFYYNPELLQGFGLHDTTGAAGFPNGEAQKSNFPYPHYSTSRLFLRQTIGLGGEQEKIESGYGQMAATKDVSRLTFQIGRFAVHDVFDTNSYAQDARVDFLNWSIWAAGAFDYPADKVGLGYGAVAELNQKYWAVRVGYFLAGNEPNSNHFDMNLFTRGGYVAELETRYFLFSRPGEFRVGVWANSYFAGSYSGAIDLTVLNPGLDPTDALVQTRKGRTKYGYYLNFEQSITDTVGIFGRWSWNDGKNEIMAFTDIDASLSFGTSIAGAWWGRPNDRIGLAGAINSISRDHRDYLAVGGLGILIGDGRLNYRPESVVETFYAMNVAPRTMLTFDYQLLVNPAHNADRGPVSVFSARAHAEF